MFRYFCKTAALLAFALTLALPAGAQAAPTAIGRYGSWKAYYFMDSGEKVCFLSGQPEKQEGNYKKRGEVFFFITHWSGPKNRNVVSLSSGYAFKVGSQVTATIDGRNFTLFTQGEMAWTRDQDADTAIAEALRKGSKLVVRGVSKRDNQTVDTYNLKGVSAAYDAITRECAAKKQK